MGSLNLRLWLNKINEDGNLADRIILAELEANFINLQFATTHDWSRGRIKDEDYLRRLCEGVLILAVGSTTGVTHDEAAALLRRIRATGKLPDFPKPMLWCSAPLIARATWLRDIEARPDRNSSRS